MSRRKEFHERYRGVAIVEVFQVEQFADEGLVKDSLGYMPRIPNDMTVPATSYALGHPRSVDEVKAWIDSCHDRGLFAV